MQSVLRTGAYRVALLPSLSAQHVKAVVNGGYESAEIGLVRLLLRPGDRVLEIGSGLGIVTLNIAGIIGAPNVRSFEANPAMAEAARANGKLNGYDFDIRNALMLGEKSGELQRSFYVDRNFLASSQVPGGRDSEEITVETAFIDDEIESFAPTAIVADVEGAEKDLFKGRALPGVNTVIIELHPALIGAGGCMEVLRSLVAAGFMVDTGLVSGTVMGLRRGPSGPVPARRDERALSALSAFLDAAAAFQNGRHGVALEALETAIALEPDTVEFHLQKAQIHLRMGDNASAIADLGRVAAEAPLGDAGLNLLAIAQLRLGVLTEAAESLGRLSAEAKALPQSLVLEAQVAMRLGQIDKARQNTLAAVELAPGVEEYTELLARIEQRLASSGGGNPTPVAAASPASRRPGADDTREMVLHIGLPKTATSYIQRWMMLNAKALRAKSIWVPPRQIWGHRLAVEAITNPKVSVRDDVRSIMATSFDESLRQLLEAAPQPRYRSLLISSEYFYEADPQVVFDRIVTPSGLPARIVLMLRRQDRLIESGYNQSVKAMGMTDPVMVPRYLPNLDWFVLISSWAKVFGADRIEVLNYDNAAQAGTVLGDFLAKVDPTLTAAELADFADVPVSNESLPADMLEFKRLANSHGEFGLQEFLYRMLESGYKGPAFRMTAERARETIELYRASNERVAREVLGSDKPLFAEYGGLAERGGDDFHGRLPVATLARITAFFMKDTLAQITALKAEVAALKTGRPVTRRPPD